MSKVSYAISFDPREVQREIDILMRTIQRTLEQTATAMDRSRSERIASLDWTPVKKEFGNASIPTDLFEVKVPPEFTEEAKVFEERALVSVEESGLRITVTDASLPEKKCDEVAIKIAERIYEQATGKTIPKDRIIVNRISVLSTTICEHCLQTIETFPYRCNNCGRCFCYDHKNPESHGCGVKQKVSKEDAKVVQMHPKSDAKMHRIVVNKIPCG